MGRKKEGFCSWTQSLPSLPHTLPPPRAWVPAEKAHYRLETEGQGSDVRSWHAAQEERRQVLARAGGCPGSQDAWGVALALRPTCCVTSCEPLFLCCSSPNCNRSWVAWMILQPVQL